MVSNEIPITSMDYDSVTKDTHPSGTQPRGCPYGSIPECSKREGSERVGDEVEFPPYYYTGGGQKVANYEHYV